jgi:hypothetical protein
MDLHWLPAQVAQQRNYGSLPDTIVYMLLLYNLDFCFDWFGLSAHASYRTASGVRVLETWSPAESMTLPMLRCVQCAAAAVRRPPAGMPRNGWAHDFVFHRKKMTNEISEKLRLLYRSQCSL